MRILTISNYYPPYEIGGYEQLCRDVNTRLRARGHEVVVLTSRHGVEGGKVSAEPNIHRRLHLQIQPGLSPMAQFILARRRRERHNRAVMRALAADFQPDVFFCWNLENLGTGLAAVAGQLPRAGVAHWIAGRAPGEPDLYWEYWTTPGHRRVMTWLKHLGRPYALRLLRAEAPRARLQLAHVGVVSHFWRDQLVQCGFLPASAQVIHNGVELDLFHQPARKALGASPRLLQVGRLDHGKGAHTALEALAVLVNDMRLPARLTLAGSGPLAYRRYLDQLVERHELENYVRFTGWLPREQMPALLAEHDLLLLPTVTPEPLARAALEAMAAGMVVVGTTTGGMGELLHDGMTGLTFAPQDAAGLARAVNRLAADANLTRRLAAAGQTLVRAQYGLDRMVDQCERLLTRAHQAVES